MKIILGNLPDNTEQEDIEKLMEEYAKVKSVERLDEAGSDRNEFLVTLEDENRVTADAVVDKLNGRHWKNVKITASVLLFQNGTDAEEK